VVLRSADTVPLAVTLNGSVVEGHHLRVDTAASNGKYDYKRTVFVGNLHYAVTDEELRGVFEPRLAAGSAGIDSVRVVRSKSTHQGKGIAYVLFKDRAQVAEALAANGTELRGRALRVARCAPEGASAAAGGGAAAGGAGADGRIRAAQHKTTTGKALPKHMGLRGHDKAASAPAPAASGAAAKRVAAGLAPKPKHAGRKAAQAAAAGGAGAAAPAAAAPAAAASPAPAPAPAKKAKGGKAVKA